MSKKTKVIAGLFIMVCLVLLMASGCTGKKNGNNATSDSGTTESTSAPAADGTPAPDTSSESTVVFPLKDPITVDFVLPEHPTQGKNMFADDGNPGFVWLEEQTNIHINGKNQIPQANAKDRFSLMLSTNDLPDILFAQGAGWTLNDVEKAGDGGLFVNVLDEKYKALIPNYLKLIENTPSLKAMVNNGKLYGFYQVDPLAAAFTGTFPIRKDIFDKHNLKFDTWDELYEALKVLKKEYPKSYPFGAANQGDTVSILSYGPANFRSGNSIYYNHDKKEWVYGATEDNYKLFLEFFAKLYKEKLLNPEFSTMTYEQWSQSWVDDETFISWWWSATGNWFSPDNAAKNPNFGRDKEWVAAYEVPSIVKGGPRGWLANSAPSNVSNEPKLISAKSKHIEEILALLDFVADRDNATSLAYGPKGVEWDIIDGKYKWLAKDIKVSYNPTGTKSAIDYFKEKYKMSFWGESGFSVNHDSQVDYDLSDAYGDPDYKQFLDEVDMYVKDGTTQTIPQPVLRFSPEDSETQAQLKATLDTYSKEITIKIINGSLPLSEFDNMKKKLEELGSQKLIDLYKKGSGM